MLRWFLLLMVVLTSQSASATWRLAETQHFRIHGTVSEARLREEAAILEDYHALLEALTARSFAADAPLLDIYLVDNRSQMKIIWPSVGTDIAGFYSATSGGILAIALEPERTGRRRENGRETLLHEYAHHFMMQAGTTALPAWYVEGFAEYLMTARFRPDRIEYGDFNMGRAWSLQNGSWLPIEALLLRPKGRDMDMFYAQSWLLTTICSGFLRCKDG